MQLRDYKILLGLIYSVLYTNAFTIMHYLLLVYHSKFKYNPLFVVVRVQNIKIFKVGLYEHWQFPYYSIMGEAQHCVVYPWNETNSSTFSLQRLMPPAVTLSLAQLCTLLHPTCAHLLSNVSWSWELVQLSGYVFFFLSFLFCIITHQQTWLLISLIISAHHFNCLELHLGTDPFSLI